MPKVEIRQSYELQHLLNVPPEQIKTLNEQNLYPFYFSTVLQAENMLFPDRNSRMHKLLFLAGGPENDLSVSTDEKGRSLYFNKPNYPKLPEIPEAEAAISEYFVTKANNPDSRLNEANLIKVMSEIADVFHNLIGLIKLDSDYEKTYKNVCINHLLKSLSSGKKFSLNDAVITSYLKYKERLIDSQEKDIRNENTLLRKAMTPNDKGESLIQIPSDEGLKCGFRAMNEIREDVLKPRIQLIKRITEWNGNGHSFTK